MYLNGKISVLIGGKEVQTVVAVSFKNDSGSIGSHCDITVPLITRIKAVDGKGDFTTDYTLNNFAVGNEVLVKAKYVGYDWVTVFAGYVYDFIEGTPMKIKCIDEVYYLNQSLKTLSYKKTTFQSIMTEILAGTGITIVEPKLDFTLEKITFKYMSPAAILEWFRKELGLNINITGKSLYVNIASNTTETIYLDTSINVLKSDLQKPDAIFRRVNVKRYFYNGNGTRTLYEAGDPNGECDERTVVNIPDNAAIRKLITEQALVKARQRRYRGTVETLLYPDCDLYAKVVYKDIRFPARSANYTIQSVEVDLTEKGFRRKLKLAFLDETETINGSLI